MERFAANPIASISVASHSWGETIAAYRFPGNDDVKWPDIMAPQLTANSKTDASASSALRKWLTRCPPARLVHMAGRHAALLAMMRRAHTLNKPAD
jgi:hypothetical protein